MTAVDTRRAPAELALPHILRKSAVLTWHELPRVISASAIWLLGFAPVVAAVLTGQWWLIALATVPAALLTTGFAAFAARVERGERGQLRDLARIDAVLAVTIVAAGTLAERLVATGGGVELLGFLVAATTIVVAPLALAYGAVRARTGLAALRGGAILVAYRPSAALTMLALGCIAAFAVAASAGALGVVVPCIIAVFSSAVVRQLVERINANGGPE